MIFQYLQLLREVGPQERWVQSPSSVEPGGGRGGGGDFHIGHGAVREAVRVWVHGAVACGLGVEYYP